jgi:hypothetical protein
MQREHVPQQLPTILTIYNGAFALDGGTTYLSATDEAGKDHRVLLIQHAFARPDAPPQALPGRLYFDGELISVRSALEGALLKLLRSATVRVKDEPQAEHQDRISQKALILGDDIKRVVQGSPEQNLRAMLQGIIDYLASDGYVSFAAKVDEMRRGVSRHVRNTHHA